VIVNTNILFSALQVKKSKIRDILLDNQDIAFYAPNFIVTEIFKHKERILAKSKIDEDELYEVLNYMLYVIQFVNEKLVSTANIIEAYKLCNDIDPKAISLCGTYLRVRS